MKSWSGRGVVRITGAAAEAGFPTGAVAADGDVFSFWAFGRIAEEIK
jgi:hypothetical protein